MTTELARTEYALARALVAERGALGKIFTVPLLKARPKATPTHATLSPVEVAGAVEAAVDAFDRWADRFVEKFADRVGEHVEKIPLSDDEIETDAAVLTAISDRSAAIDAILGDPALFPVLLDAPADPGSTHDRTPSRADLLTQIAADHAAAVPADAGVLGARYIAVATADTLADAQAAYEASAEDLIGAVETGGSTN